MHTMNPSKNYFYFSGTVLFSNSYTVHMDQDYWKDPETFRPERFLNEKGQYKSDERN